MEGQDSLNMAVKVKTVEAKKTQPVNTKTQDVQTSANIVEFVGDIKSELKKINWTSPEELKVYTKLVVAMTFVLGMTIYFLDVIIHGALSILDLFMHWIA